MSGLIVRRGVAQDAASIASMIAGFADDHPARDYPRSIERMCEAFWGPRALAHPLVAEKQGSAIGIGVWRKTFDVFWSMYGGDVLALYVHPAHRRSGVAACIVAAMCGEIQQHGGSFLQASYDPRFESLYERLGVGRAERTCHVSATAFEALAAMAGMSAREILRGLPAKALNYAPPGRVV